MQKHVYPVSKAFSPSLPPCLDTGGRDGRTGGMMLPATDSRRLAAQGLPHGRQTISLHAQSERNGQPVWTVRPPAPHILRGQDVEVGSGRKGKSGRPVGDEDEEEEALQDAGWCSAMDPPPIPLCSPVTGPV
ncbi:hypothetical protein GGTG_02936 [Gaeumannomyces tritici R3-111a-1]|uniref:Uncharacterized protein n=1 Tax=Gaeumannomyces tritici (strain R3-111a-1) TaxID=644352 RepID=J3NNT0_GAET3|nr:hypothetical protein GGTG_02936 [Gaeumannomyces tritici R3-111a-1]EJT77833.1 hypothetical protein GGTG_02936 [Gaeumannomyces tritici R3-111a-1]